MENSCTIFALIVRSAIVPTWGDSTRRLHEKIFHQTNSVPAHSYFTIAILIPAGIATVMGIKFIYNQIITRAETKTLSDLNSAREIYRNKISQIESITRFTAVRSLIIGALADRDRVFFQKDLPKTLHREKLDILTVLDQNGTVVCRGRNIDAFGDNLLGDRLVARAIQTKQIVTGTDIVPREELLRDPGACRASVHANHPDAQSENETGTRANVWHDAEGGCPDLR